MRSHIQKIREEPGDEIHRVILLNGDADTLPMYLLRPTKVAPPYQVMICLQGHAPGMYISIGETRSEQDIQLVMGGSDLAIQV